MRPEPRKPDGWFVRGRMGMTGTAAGRTGVQRPEEKDRLLWLLVEWDEGPREKEELLREEPKLLREDELWLEERCELELWELGRLEPELLPLGGILSPILSENRTGGCKEHYVLYC